MERRAKASIVTQSLHEVAVWVEEREILQGGAISQRDWESAMEFSQGPTYLPSRAVSWDRSDRHFAQNRNPGWTYYKFPKVSCLHQVLKGWVVGPYAPKILALPERLIYPPKVIIYPQSVPFFPRIDHLTTFI